MPLTTDWLLHIAVRWLGCFMFIEGIAAYASEDRRLPVSAFTTDLADVFHMPPHLLLGVWFLIPGILLMLGNFRFRTVGLYLAFFWFSIYTVGLAQGAAFRNGTFTAPVTFAFFSVFTAGLIAERRARKVKKE
jgi:hypothetical protein